MGGGSKDSSLSAISENKGSSLGVPDAGSRPGSKERIVVRGRRTSKTVWKRSITRTDTVEIVGSPQFMWEKYLKHCTAEQLNWLSEEFENNEKDVHGGMPIEEAVRIVEDWIVLTHECENPTPDPAAVKECRAAALGSRGVTMGYEQLVTFVSLCEQRVLQADRKAGFSEMEVLELKAAFLEHATDRGFNDKTRLSLSTLDTFNVLTTLGRNCASPRYQKNVIEVIKQVDKDKSGDLDFEEYLQLVRKVQMSDAAISRQNEHAQIHSSGFSDEEIEGFQELFMYWSTPDNKFKFQQMLSLLDSMEMTLDQQLKRQLLEIIKVEAGANYDNSKEDSECIIFGVFLMVLRRLFEKDFAGIRGHSQDLFDMRAEEQKYMSPEDWQTRRHKSIEAEIKEQQKGATWIRRMIDKKEDTQKRVSQQMESTSPKGMRRSLRTSSSVTSQK